MEQLRGKKFVILLHEHAKFIKPDYTLHLLIKEWRAWGVEIEVLNGTNCFVKADAVILHISLTVVPEVYLRFAERYPVAINGKVADISKRRVSANLIDRFDDYDGPVIVKTNLNYGGMPELSVATLSSPIGRLKRLAKKSFPSRWSGYLAPEHYPIHESKSDVADWIWKDSRLVVEKFLPELVDDHHCLRQWCFLGDQGSNVLALSKNPIVKNANTIKYKPVADIPEELFSIRREMDFDYGKFDYTIVDGKAILYDANSTPTYDTGTGLEQAKTNAAIMAKGITAFVS